MSSARKPRTALPFRLKLTLWYVAIFLLSFAGFHFAFCAIFDDGVDEEVEFVLARAKTAWGEESGMTREDAELVWGRVQRRVNLDPDTERILHEAYLVLGLPILLLAIAGGLLITQRASRPLYALGDTVRGILDTGEIDRRVPVGGAGPQLTELITLVNQMLDRIEKLVTAMHESLDNVAHDLRTPMTRMRAIAEEALERDDPEAVREALGDCLEESERVLTMLTTLMDVAEAETGVMRLRRTEVELGDLLHSIAEIYELVAEEKNITLDIVVPEEVTIDADPTRLQQVVANLVDNAIKYGRAGETVTVSARQAGNEAVITVQDQGIGIAPGELPRIWDRLYRSDRSRGERGLGLGLSFVRAVVEAHGGSVDVESTVNRGSTFTVRLPVRRASTT